MHMHRAPCPVARTEDLIVTESDGDTLVYDLRTHRAHALDATAATLWRLCDGDHDLPALAAALPETVENDAVLRLESARYAIERLRAAGLLRETAAATPTARRLSRRDLLRRAAAAGVTTVMVPTVLSVVAPTTLQAQASCLPAGAICVPGGTRCCAPFQCQPSPGRPPTPGPPAPGDRFCQ